MCNFILFGASGDISKKKVFPGLYEWYKDDCKSIKMVIGYGRKSLTKKDFHKIIDIDDADFLKHFDYQIGKYNLCNGFRNLKNKIVDCGVSKGERILLYFGVPSYIAPDIIKNIVLTNIEKDYDCRYILEKPIGNNLDSCIVILDSIYDMIETNKVYILDHYLGKSGIRDMIDITSNKINITDIKIYLNEIESVEHRIEYFDKVGLFKDMVQSHVITILMYCFPKLFSSNLSLSSNNDLVNIIVKKHIIGQYKGYSGNKNVDTYLKLHIEWNNVNLIIEAGKCMGYNKKEIHYMGDTNSIVKINSEYSEYKCLFQDILNNNNEKFLSSDCIKYFWELSEHILKQGRDNIIYYDSHTI